MHGDHPSVNQLEIMEKTLESGSGNLFSVECPHPYVYVQRYKII